MFKEMIHLKMVDYMSTETCRDIECVYCDLNNIIEVETVLIV
jgi:hypothetical protein